MGWLLFVAAISSLVLAGCAEEPASGGTPNPQAQSGSRDGLLIGDYQMMVDGEAFDTWSFDPQCRTAVVGRYADITAGIWGDLIANYHDSGEWSGQSVGTLPICTGGKSGQGRMSFEVYAQTLKGSMTIVREDCGGSTKPYSNVISFDLEEA